MEKKLNALITWNLNENYLYELRQEFPGIVFNICLTPEEINEKVCHTDLIYAGILNREQFIRAKQLKWIQLNGHGANAYLFKELIQSNIQITNSGQVHAIPIAEHVFAFILNDSRKIVELKDGQRQNKWVKQEIYPFLSEINEKTIGIIGVGNIGEEVAKRAKAFNMNVYGVRKNADFQSNYVDRMYSIKELDDVIKQSDYIVVTLPETPETLGLIGKKQFSLMKKEAFFINVGRGSVIVEEELCHILHEKKIAGAALDVFQEEPLPTESKLYEMDNLFISPHLSGATPLAAKRQVGIFKENLTRFLENRSLLNVVNKERGY